MTELVSLYERATDQRDDAERRRREVGGRLERIRELYKWGDMTREAYVAERDHLEAELGTLRGTTDRAAVLTQAAAMLRDLPAAWTAASPEQRNALARLAFQSVEIEDDRVVAVLPQPDFAPFFVAEAVAAGRLDENGNGPGGPGLSSEVLTGRKRRGSDSCLRHSPPGSVVIAEAPPRPVSGRSKRASYHAPRRRKLTAEQEAAIRALAVTKSLRSVATDFGVSHETVRAILRERGVGSAA